MLVGRRQLRSNNSWMHNLELLVSGPERCTLHVHPDDAERLGLADGEPARVRNRAGELRGARRGHRRGHARASSRSRTAGATTPPARGSAVAGEHAGVNSNVLADEELVDALSGNAVLNGIPVVVAPRRGADPGVSGPDFEALGLLDGLDGRARDARLRLLRVAARERRAARGDAEPRRPRGGSRCCRPSMRSAVWAR